MPLHTLITPLDWGLGHASRSLALARRLEREGDRVSWASSGPAAAMLRRELPGTTIYPLPAYAVRYPSRNMYYNVARQAWRWWRTLRAERRAVARLVGALRPDRIVSDSRFGCYHPGVRSVMLTHQLHPITHFAPASALYKYRLGHFDEYWVPDHADPHRLTGRLSEAAGYENVRYIGQLSRLQPGPGEDAFDVLVLLSGPEPMRSRLEEIVLRQLPALSYSYRLVRGLAARTQDAEEAGNHYGYADESTLSRLLTAARCVVARSGYSTLMDLRTFDKPAVLIPTPGQTEQIYLAQRAVLQGWAVAVPDQDKLDLGAALRRLGPVLGSM